MRDKDLAYGIRNGQLTLSGTEMTSLFEPSIIRIKDAIHNQLSAAQTPVNVKYLVDCLYRDNHTLIIVDPVPGWWLCGQSVAVLAAQAVRTSALFRLRTS